MENENKRFEEWKVDCNECERYWDSSCDGVSKDKKRACSQFSATRSVVIPLQIERLTKVVKGLVWAVCLLSAAFIIHIINGWF